jgi:cytochrome c peroxidase
MYFCTMRFLQIFLLSIFFVACQKTPMPVVGSDPVSEYLNLPTAPFNYANQPLPDYMLISQLLNVDNTPAHNPVTDHGATLGRVLFYEKGLSKNNTISCASCHKQEKAFSDDAIFSEGWEGHETGRHSMGIINGKYYYSGKFFWDERVASLEQQTLMPIQDSVEMGLTLNEMEERLKGLPYYKPLFTSAFGNDEITSEKAAMAMAQFIRSIVSYRTKYDTGRFMMNTQFGPFNNFSDSENLGKKLFNGFKKVKCASCHGSDAFASTGGRNNGLDASTTDAGIGGVTGASFEMSTFKAPSLKSVLLRAPYMHDGRFSTIEEVIEHYNSGVQNHPNLDQDLKDFDTGLAKSMDMTELEKTALVDFLKTLTDNALVTDEKFSNPFK